MEVYDELLEKKREYYSPLIAQIHTSIINCQWYQLGALIINLFQPKESIGFRKNIFEYYFKQLADFLKKDHLISILYLISEEIQEPKFSISFLSEYLQNFEQSSEYYDTLQLYICKYQIEDKCFATVVHILSDVESHFNDLTSIQLKQKFYEMQVKFDKSQDNYDLFYQHGLLFLSTSSQIILNDITFAHDICIAALFSQTTFSFSELANHQILDILKNTDLNWLRELILLIDRGEKGSIQIFEKTFVPIIISFPKFSSKLELLRNKIKLGMLYQLVFLKPFNNREISFKQIMKYCSIPKEEVDYLIMKAFSSHLFDGSIDGIKEVIFITWVKPKILSIDKIKHLKTQLDLWKETISSKRQNIQEVSSPIIY